MADLVRRASRRLNPTRVIVRGAARCAVRRFEQYGLGARPRVPPEAIAYRLAEVAPIILHLAGDESSEGQLRRYCTSIVEVTGLEEGRVTATELWSLDRAGLADTRPASPCRAPVVTARAVTWSVSPSGSTFHGEQTDRTVGRGEAYPSAANKHGHGGASRIMLQSRP